MNEIKAGVIVAAKLPISESTRKRNPQLFGPLGAVEDTQRKHNQRSESKNPKLDGSKTRLEYRVTILSLRKRLVDAHDNLRTGAKPLVDRITYALGFYDDADPRLHWEYAQALTSGQEGVIVKIEESAGAATQE